MPLAVLFGSLLTYTGGDRWFMDVSLRLTGRLRVGRRRVLAGWHAPTLPIGTPW